KTKRSSTDSETWNTLNPPTHLRRSDPRDVFRTVLRALADVARVDDHRIPVDLDGHVIHWPRRGARHVLTGDVVNRAVARAHEKPVRLAPGHRASEVRTLPVEGDDPLRKPREVE